MADRDDPPVWPVPPARSFVGRSAHLALLGRVFDEVVGGLPGVVLIEGDAGIGKSRLAAEVVRKARHRGARILIGRCTPGHSVPYLPLAMALEPLGDELGAAARLLDPPAAPTDDSLADAARLAAPLVAACRATVRAARRRPTVLLVEDLHWADPHTAELLEHLVSTSLDAGAAAPTALLVLATMRRPADHVTRLVARLRREPAVRSLFLDGLNELELNELLTSLAAPARPSRELLAEMATATRGNPLLVRTLLDRLTESGYVSVRGGELVSTVAELALLAGDLDDELRGRLERVSTPCRALLTRAAFLGDGGLLADLAAVAPPPASSFEMLVDEAEAAGLLHDDGERFRFDHPQLGHLLYQGPEGRARERLHLAIADELEASHGGDTRRAMEIADHLRRARVGVEPARLARWCMAAGEQAFALAAWGAAARFVDDALAADPPDEPTQRAQLALRSGIGHFRDHDLARAEQHLQEAIDAAKTAGEVETWARAALVLTRARLTIGPGSVGARVDTSELEDVLAATPAGHRRAGEIIAVLAEVRFHAFDFDEGQTLLDEARRLAQRDGDDSLATNVDLAAGLQHLGRLELDAAAGAFAASAQHARRLADPWQRVWGVGRLPLVEVMRGDLRDAAAHSDEADAIAAANHDWAERALAAASAMQVAVVRGDYGAAEISGSTALQMYRRSDYAFIPALIYPAFAAARAARGDVAGAHEALDDWTAAGGRGLAPYRLLIAASEANANDPHSQLQGRTFRPVGALPLNLFSLPVLCAQVEVAAVTGNVDLLADAYVPLMTTHDAGVRWCLGWPLQLARLLATADRGLGRLDQAERWCATAFAEALRAGSAAEQARVTLERARIVAARGDGSAGRMLADEAAAKFDQLGMLPLLQVAHRFAGGGPADRLVRTILFTDLVGSTELNIRRGDAAYLQLLQQHNAILRRGLRRFDGVEVKHTGDGIGAWFASSPSACECALAIRDDLADHNASHPDTQLFVRFGLASGSPIPHEGDFFGVVMSLAARLCDQAAPGQVVVSEDVAAAVDSTRVTFRALGSVALKGFPEAVQLFAAEGGSR